MGRECQIRQQVSTVKRSWLEVIAIGSSRLMEYEYDELCKAHPNEYFELVEVKHIESCLAFRKKPEA